MDHRAARSDPLATRTTISIHAKIITRGEAGSEQVQAVRIHSNQKKKRKKKTRKGHRKNLVEKETMLRMKRGGEARQVKKNVEKKS